MMKCVPFVIHQKIICTVNSKKCRTSLADLRKPPFTSTLKHNSESFMKWKSSSDRFNSMIQNPDCISLLPQCTFFQIPPLNLDVEHVTHKCPSREVSEQTARDWEKRGEAMVQWQCLWLACRGSRLNLRHLQLKGSGWKISTLEAGQLLCYQAE